MGLVGLFLPSSTRSHPFQEYLMNELIQTFNFGVNEVRTAIKDNGDVYFCLVDVLPVLGLENRAISKFNLDDKGVEKLATPT